MSDFTYTARLPARMLVIVIRAALLGFVGLAGCNQRSATPGMTGIDASQSYRDAPVYVPPPCIALGSAFCSGSGASTYLQFIDQAMLHHACTPPASWSGGGGSWSAACASGCSINGHETFSGFDTSGFVLTPELLCAEAPEAKFGDACDATSRSCIPTRARLNPDGTVAGQSYLACVSGVCQSVFAPTLTNYLARCDATTIAQYGTSGATGVVVPPDYGGGTSACLLAWDSSAQAAASGITRVCIGDWECPAGALCDDSIPILDSVLGPVAVCKPGPRSTLTPAMLSK